LGGKDLAGGKLKEAGTSHWIEPNTAGTNESGFTAFAGGHRQVWYKPQFVGLGYESFFWSSTLNTNGVAYLDLYYQYGYIHFPIFTSIGQNGFSVRCIKN